MNNKELNNPFVVNGYVSGDFFCDREAELSELKSSIANGRNLALISARRMGKTGLIHHLFAQPDIQDQYYTFFVDIYATGSVQELIYLLGKQIFDQLKPRHTQWTERFWQVVTSLRAGFKIDSLTGQPSFELGVGTIDNPATTLDEIFEYLESADKPCIVAIDEFQQIAEYPEDNVEALLRSKIQMCHQTRFIFSGSRRHVMSQMFLSRSKPFYQSALVMGLEPIDLQKYADFAQRMFSQYGKLLSQEVVPMIYKSFAGTTWYMQMILNDLFAMTPQGTQCTPDMVEEAQLHVEQLQESAYKEMLNLMPIRQKPLLQALAREGQAKGITSAAFIRKHGLSSASSIQSAAKGLIAKDIITCEEGIYRIYDYFFSDWVKRNF